MVSNRLLAVLAVVVAADSAVLGQVPENRSANAPGRAGASTAGTAWDTFALNPKTRIKLDFRDASADAVLRAFSTASGIAIIKDPALTAPITLQSPTPQPLSTAFAMLNAALGLRSYDLVREGNFLMVKGRQQRALASRANPAAVPGASAGADSRGFGRRGGDQQELRVYRIRYANATQVARVINEVFANYTGSEATAPATSPAVPGAPGGQPGAQPGGPPPGGPGGPPPASGAENQQSTLPETAVQVAQQRGGFGGFQGGGRRRQGGMTGGAPTGTSLVKASADDFSNSVIVNAPSRLHAQIAQIVSQIDRQTEQPQQSRVFKLQYAAASDLAVVIQNVLLSNAPRGRGGLTASTATTPIDQRFSYGSRAATQTALGSVVADTRTNSLIVTATQENLQIIAAVVTELDKPVAVENSSFVINLKNANAETIADLINQATGGRAASGANRSSGAATGGTTGTQMQRPGNTGGGYAPGGN